MSDALSRIDVSKLNPEFLAHLRGFCDACQAHGIDLRATSGYRDSRLQAVLYARFKAGGPRAAPPGHSLHEKGLAVDFLIYRQGQPVNDGDDPAYAEMHAVAERYSLKGLPPELHDMGHIERA